MKKFLVWLLSLSTILCLTACGAADSAEVTDDGHYAIGVCVSALADEYMARYCAEMEAYFKSQETETASYTLSVADAGGDAVVQMTQVEELLGQESDLLIVELTQAELAQDVIHMAAQANVPLILIRSEPDMAPVADSPGVWYVGRTEHQAYTYMGQIIAALEDRGDINGDEKVSYVMLRDAAEVKEDTEACLLAWKACGMAAEELAAVAPVANADKAAQALTDLLSEQEESVEVVFCHSDAMIQGAVQAVAEAGLTVGKDLYLVGVGTSDECVTMVGSKKVTGLVMDDYIAQAQKTADVTMAVLAGETPQNDYRVDDLKVTQ